MVTGAGRGVGRSHALLLAAKGARVVVADYGVGIDGGGSSPAPAEDGRQGDQGRRRPSRRAIMRRSPTNASALKRSWTPLLSSSGGSTAMINNAGIHDPALFDDC